jgi:hypothetical protein
MDDEQAVVIVAVWRAGSKDYRDIQGEDLLEELRRQGAPIDEGRLARMMDALRDDGLLEMYVGGGGRGTVTNIHNIQLSSLGRARAADLPEAGGRAGLEPEQEQLLVEMVEAANRVPRPEQAWHLGDEDQSEVMRGPWGHRSVLPDDVSAIEKAGLLKATHRSLYGIDYVLTPAARRHYASVKRRVGEPVARQEGSVRAFLESDELRSVAPAAFEKWGEAERLLWSANSENELSTIGHKLREALQDFASALVEAHEPADVNTDVAKTLDRLSAVIRQQHLGLGERRRRLFDALFGYCRVAIELVQRQEHGGQREGEPLEWEDGRRAVFHAAVVMLEVVSVLRERPAESP